jgi:hypothetical protein
MTYGLIGNCPRCGWLPTLKPNWGGWMWVCGCPPTPTFTSGNTVTPQAFIDAKAERDAGWPEMSGDGELSEREIKDAG